ncbi:TetR/AcrR family transcriptional regulator [Paenibacillus sp. 1781tsa1]|nr:TetR/AcrR family transcriptional regulator [Paenibacillus sp. 1781tsa1]
MVSITDRRVLKSQEAIKSAFIRLMNEKSFDTITMQDISDHANVGRRTIYHHFSDKFDLLDKLIEEHIEELRRLCKEASDLDFIESNVLWFDYFEMHYSFFSAMIQSKGAPFFRSRLLALVIEELEDEVNITEGKNKGLTKDVILTFLGTALVGIVESYFTNGLPRKPHFVAEQVGILFDRNL